jgi:hypothetical protein
MEDDFATVARKAGLPGTGEMVQHAKGAVGMVLHVDPVGPKGRPTYLVLTSAGQRAWWYQDRCEKLSTEAVSMPRTGKTT